MYKRQVNDGAQVVQLGCNGSLTQLWSNTYLGMGHYRIQSIRNGKCLDVQGGIGSGRPAVLNACTGSASQSWLIARQPLGQDTWWDYRVSSQLCLSVPGSNRNDWVGLVVNTCTGFSSQVFRTVIANGP